MSQTHFFHLSDDILLAILFKLQEDPRHWACLACVCTKFSSLIRTVCYQVKCSQSIPSVVSELLSSSFGRGSYANTLAAPTQWWASLHKLSVCCPGLLHAGVLLESSDFGLERAIGPDHNYSMDLRPVPSSSVVERPAQPPSDISWSLFDDLYFDMVYDSSETEHRYPINTTASTTTDAPQRQVVPVGNDLPGFKRRRQNCEHVGSHLAKGIWNLSREQGNKLLASRFRGDCLYICDWPGCIHTEQKRDYMLFRGVFKNFKSSRVWRTINDGNRSQIALECAFCSCKKTYDLHSAFCLRRVFGFHDDGEPVVRAYVCENGHVSGAWTDRPMYA
ncbi:phytochrome A-associated F-box protein-like [Aristolochia californica]|uniref:phytochrome A-associated F-box protein-like n=1 Tax=Aristolochia californica TaxID=171875 RepID=UPI0035DE3C22